MQPKQFPIMVGYRGTPGPCPSSIPWEAIAPYDGQAKYNHGGQSLERLAERGGLSPLEAFCVMTGKTLNYTDSSNWDVLSKEACEYLDTLVRSGQIARLMKERDEKASLLDTAQLEINTLKNQRDHFRDAWRKNESLVLQIQSIRERLSFESCGCALVIDDILGKSDNRVDALGHRVETVAERAALWEAKVSDLVACIKACLIDGHVSERGSKVLQAALDRTPAESLAWKRGESTEKRICPRCKVREAVNETCISCAPQ